MNLVLNIKSAYDTLADHQEPFDSLIDGDTIHLRPHVGKGYIQAVPLMNGISLIRYDFVLHQPMTVDAVVEATTDTYSIFLNVLANSVHKHIGDSEEDVSRHGSTGLFFYSPDTTSHAVYQANEHYVLLFITFTREGLQPLLETESARALLTPGRRFAFYQPVDLYVESLTKQIFQDRETLHRMRLLGQTMLLIDHVIQHSISENRQDLSGFLQDDIRKLFEARKLLTLRHDNPPTIMELSSLVGMNETKLKKAFKQVFNLSIHQYSQSARMLRAKELLESKRYSASEVAYRVGYTNLTHFGEAFRKHFNVLPGHYLGTVLNDPAQMG